MRAVQGVVHLDARRPHRIVGAMTLSTFVVRKDRLASFETRHTEAPPLADAQVRVAIDRFALTANNVTYAALGEAMDYWKFFPTADPAWGCIPVWGFGTVQASRHPEIAAGERLYGYFPMASEVDLSPTRVKEGSFVDGAPHRAALHAVYNQYTRCSADPFYSAGTEDLQALLRPLFTTSWLVDDFLADNRYFGAADAGPAAMLLSSASSKTAYGTAFQMKQRGDVEVVGLTSSRNLAFCESLGCYDRVVPYDGLEALAADTPCNYVDFAGSVVVRQAVHQRFTRLAYSCAIGATHVDAMGGGKGLPGPKPVLFFAPAQVKKRSTEWGPQGLGERLVASWRRFLAAVAGEGTSAPWMHVVHHRGPAEAAAAYREVLAGQGDARLGHIVSM
jgi:hypothetical protein